MIWTLIWKDCCLMRAYLRLAGMATIVGYVASAMLVYYLTEEYREIELRTLGARAVLTLKTGLWLGTLSTGLIGALLAGSVFTQERGDRSAEFLACLPPSRFQNLASKLIVSLGTTMLMCLVHILAAFATSLLVPFARTDIATLDHELSQPDFGNMALWFGMAFSMYGGALAASAWMKTNGFPILCGFITPIAIFSLRSLVSQWLEIPYRGNEFQAAVALSSWILGGLLIFLASYWYLTRWEP